MADSIPQELPPHAPYASLGGGCFWCMESEFRWLPGVLFTLVTTLEPQAHFWPTEEYHQQYYEKYEKSRGVPHPRALHKMRK